MEEGVLKYGEHDGEQCGTRRVHRGRESNSRVTNKTRKAEKIRVSTGVRVSLPLYQEHHAPTPSASRDLGINDRLYYVLFFVISQVSWYWWRRALVVEGRRVVRRKKCFVENIVNLPGIRNLQTVRGCADLLEDLEGTITAIVEGL